MDRPLSFIVIFLVSATAFAQTTQSTRFEHLNTEIGLSNNNVNAIIQDSMGFIWAGTDDGLCRFDAYQFINLCNEANGKDLIRSTHINCLTNAIRGKILVGTQTGGLYIFNTHSFAFLKPIINDLSNPILNSDIRSIVEAGKNQYYIGTLGDGLWKYDISKQKVTPLLSDNKGLVLNITSLVHCSNKLYIGTEGNGIIIYDLSHHKIIDNINRKSKIIDNDTITFMKEINNRIFIGTSSGGLYCENGKIKKYNIKSNIRFPSSITMDNLGRYWITSSQNEGIEIYNEEKNNLKILKNDLNDVFSLSDNINNVAFTDKSGKIYIGSYGNGIDVTHPEKFSFKLMTKKLGSLNNSDVRFIYPDNISGGLLLGTYGGGLNYTFDNPLKNKYFLNSFMDKQSISSNYLQCIYPISDETKLIGTWEGLSIYRNESFKTATPNENGTEGRRFAILSISQLQKDDDFLVSANLDGTGYLYIYSLSKNKFISINMPKEVEKIIKRYEVLSIISLNKKDYYLLTQGGGIIKYHISNDFHIIKQKRGEINTLASNKLNHGLALDSKYILLATDGAGLQLYHPLNNTFYTIGSSQGFGGQNVYSLVSDKSGHIWCATNKGISRLTFTQGIDKFITDYVKKDYSSLKIKDFGVENNLPLIDFNAGAVGKSIADILYFGGSKGVLSLSASEIVENKDAPKTFITDIQIFNKHIRPDSLESKELKEDVLFAKQIYLDYTQNFVSIGFTGLNYILSGKNQFAYTLEAVDGKWIYADAKRRFASYSSLAPGDYIFKVKSANNDGLWGKETSIEIHISPPFYATWWFRILVAIIVISGVSATLRWRLNTIRKRAEAKAEIERKISEAQLIALRAQMNPHFIFNSLNSIQQYIYENKKEEAGKYLSKFAKLIRYILQASAQNNILLEDEIEMLQLYLELESMRFQNKFDFEIEVDDDVEPEFMEIPTMLIQPFIENAILHGIATKEGEGHIHLYMKDLGNKVMQCIIEDDGIGRVKAKSITKKKLYKYKSMGMDVTQNRLEILNQHQGKQVAVEIIDLVDDEGNGCGTRVLVNIPYEEV